MPEEHLRIVEELVRQVALTQANLKRGMPKSVQRLQAYKNEDAFMAALELVKQLRGDLGIPYADWQKIPREQRGGPGQPDA